jgi:hypothetical protein
VDKATIIRFAREHPELRVRYVRHREERFSEPYDFARDSQGLVKWYDASAEYVGGHPLALVIASNQDFLDAIRRMANEYKTFVEDNEGWRLLWNDNWTHKREEAAQLVFLGIVKHYCKANNIDVSREADIGRGPVDFKMAIGYSLRALFEVKYAENSRFWHGIEKQLPTYLRAEGVQNGFFVVIVLTDEDLKRLPGINDRTVAVSQKTGFNIEAVVVDARIHPPSASKI